MRTVLEPMLGLDPGAASRSWSYRTWTGSFASCDRVIFMYWSSCLHSWHLQLKARSFVQSTKTGLLCRGRNKDPTWVVQGFSSYETVVTTVAIGTVVTSEGVGPSSGRGVQAIITIGSHDLDVVDCVSDGSTSVPARNGGGATAAVLVDCRSSSAWSVPVVYIDGSIIRENNVVDSAGRTAGRCGGAG